MDLNPMDVTAEQQTTPEVTPTIDNLRVRGSSHYTCPHGMACKRGGVQNGQLRVFKRNSDFRTHLERHERVYKCDLPGCPNRKGFSRPDQLERHKRLVKHETDPAWTAVEF
ncbi:hypothetical protein EDB81DRAFT_801859 [Dactylonectria macrodidyma]|uniref:C2H2-type domain-containing protein n=1 Tax=Dactylonectria macrodidyma TaxID=307937 RepID=A0A9P9EBI1_9HYPO|nr:hypothetical protein EDB81DRAFT_801859 [Dactylonectria macrodidyma]